MPISTTHHLYPPFPPDLPTAPLESISLAKLESGDDNESSNFFNSCCNLGFFYIDLTSSELGETIVQDAESLQTLQQDFFALPHKVKDDFGRDKVDPFFSYRWTACQDGVKDVWNRPGRREMYSGIRPAVKRNMLSPVYLRVDDFLDIRPALDRHMMISNAQDRLSSFSQHCRQLVHLLLSILEIHLSLPSGTLLKLHRNDTPRGDFISLQHRASEPTIWSEVQKGEHTDFGSITILFNWLGGLQIREQKYESNEPGDWVYIKPIPGSCVINLADSLVKLTAGILKSNIHRVAPAPGLQAGLPRYSLVYFAHPNDDVDLVPVKGGLVDAAAAENVKHEEVVKAADWTSRRSLGDLRGVWTYRGGIEWRDLNDAVPVAERVETKA